MLSIKEILHNFALIPHPEGGAYLETYKSQSSSEFEGFEGKRSLATGIYFLLKEGEFSSLHRIRSDEMWHFYSGGPLEILEIKPNGLFQSTILGNRLSQGEKVQYVVKAGNWFAARPFPKSEFSFVGCTVSPGFDFQDFELARAEELMLQFPQHERLIHSLTHPKR
jgi:predicted cupin superfamily sugar epimerase